jgi:serine protease Do
MTLLDDLTNSGHRIAADVTPSVVGVGRRGSGVVVTRGFVATNAHNIGSGRRGRPRPGWGRDETAGGDRVNPRDDGVTVTFADGRTATAQVQAVDVDGDLAVLAVDTGDTAPVAWAETPPTPGDPVFAVANPGGRGPRLSFGIVSSVGREFRGPRGRRIGGSLEHTAPLARGSSGGPVVDRQGHVVGINTHRLDQGFYLALPVDDRLRRALDDLAEGTVPSRRSLGVAVVPPRIARRMRSAVGLADRDGLLVRAVDPEGPAAASGVRDGDLIVEAGGRAVVRIDDLHAVLDEWDEPSLDLRLVRGTDEVTVTVTFS